MNIRYTHIILILLYTCYILYLQNLVFGGGGMTPYPQTRGFYLFFYFLVPISGTVRDPRGRDSTLLLFYMLY